MQGKYIIPGIIDSHVHFCTFEYDSQPTRITSDSETIFSIAGEKNARQALVHGVTTMRDLGSKYFSSLKIRDLINIGYIPGPRILACGYALAMTGGHGTPDISMEVDGTDEIRKAVRLMRKMGADCIKLMANGLSVNSPELSAKEMRCAVDVAHDAGLRVATHASVWKAVENALEAGVDTIEHGYTLNEGLIERMLLQGTVLVPTFGTVLQVAKTGNQDPYWKTKMEAINKRIATAMTSFQLARKMGVPFALGTDGSNRPLLRIGEVLAEMRALKEVGFTNMEIIQAATSGSSRAIGKEDELGTLAPGKLADLVILNHNPLEELDAIDDIDMVIKNGKVVVKKGSVLVD